MNYWAFQRAVVTRIDALLESRATYRGSKKDLADQAKVSHDFFKELRRHAHRMPMDKVFRVIEVLGEHPARLLYEAARDVDKEALPELPPRQRKVEDFPEDHIVRKFTAVVKNERES